MTEEDKESLDDPFVLCGVTALFDALRYANERDPGLSIKKLDTIALEHFIERRRAGLLHRFFPGWKSRRMLRNEKRLASA